MRSPVGVGSLLIVAALLSCRINAGIIVKTPLGTVKGSLDHSVGIAVETFRGIPFAKPPTGERRFSLPEPFGEFGDLDATAYRAACIQSVRPAKPSVNTSEDCLHLNVFRRQGLVEGAPVIIMVHGGAFAFGSAQDFSYDGVPLAAYADAVVVTIQYRLGVLGFAMSDVIPGNVALFDQKMAIEWVHGCIHSFGGDNQRVTLMGVSAGSSAVGAHIVSPETRSKNLFQSVIMDGGVVGKLTLTPNQTRGRMAALAEKIGCPSSGQESLKCLQKVDVQVLVDQSYDPAFAATFTYVPVSDGVYIPDKVENDLLHADTYAKVRMLIGTAQDEGSLFVSNAVIQPINLTLATDQDFVEWCRQLTSLYKFRLDFDDEEVERRLKETYLSRYSDRILAASHFLGDGSFYCPSNAFIKYYSRSQSTDIFVYQFHRLFSKPYAGKDPGQLGAFHWSPHIHFAGALLTLGEELAEEDRSFSVDSMRMISHFVNGLRPVFRGVKWPEFTTTKEVLLLKDRPEIVQSLRHTEECKAMFAYQDPEFVASELQKKEL